MHTPVLLKEVLENLHVIPGGKYIDATYGEGGHSRGRVRQTQDANPTSGSTPGDSSERPSFIGQERASDRGTFGDNDRNSARKDRDRSEGSVNRDAVNPGRGSL